QTGTGCAPDGAGAGASAAAAIRDVDRSGMECAGCKSPPIRWKAATRQECHRDMKLPGHTLCSAPLAMGPSNPGGLMDCGSMTMWVRARCQVLLHNGTDQ